MLNTQCCTDAPVSHTCSCASSWNQRACRSCLIFSFASCTTKPSSPTQPSTHLPHNQALTHCTARITPAALTALLALHQQHSLHCSHHTRRLTACTQQQQYTSKLAASSSIYNASASAGGICHTILVKPHISHRATNPIWDAERES